jgi:hypothetical protein
VLSMQTLHPLPFRRLPASSVPILVACLESRLPEPTVCQLHLYFSLEKPHFDCLELTTWLRPSPQAAENMCVHKMASNLYLRIQQECEMHIAAKLQGLVGQTLDPVVFLGHVDATWQDHCEQMVCSSFLLGASCSHPQIVESPGK